MNNNLEELRDIHLPQAVSAFPPAIGWYVVLLIIIIAIILYFTIKKAIKYSKSIYAKKIIQNSDINTPVLFAKDISNLLRRICVYKYKQASAYKGLEWQEFLVSNCSYKLDKKSLDLLINAPYLSIKTKSYTIEDAMQIKLFATKFIKENL